MIVSNPGNHGLRLTENERTLAGKKVREFKDLYDQSMEEYKTMSTGATREVVRGEDLDWDPQADTIGGLTIPLRPEQANNLRKVMVE